MKINKLSNKWIPGLACLGVTLCLMGAAVPAYAQDDDDDGGTMDIGLQWRLAETTFQRNEFDDAAVLMNSFATANPDAPQAVQALWITYEIYRHRRPNPDKRKAMVLRVEAAVAREVQKYLNTDKNRAAEALWLGVHLTNNEGNRPGAIDKLQELVQKVPGTNKERDAYWHLGEWLREAKRYREAITAYDAYQKLLGVSQGGANAIFRMGWCYQELKETAKAVEAFNMVADGTYNWGWGEVHWAILDAARRLKTMGEDQLSRAYALKLLEKTPKDWVDLQNQARVLLGEPTLSARRVAVFPHLYYNYNTDRVNIDGRTKLELVRELPVLVRLENINKESPFKGSIKLESRLAMEKVPDNMKRGGTDKQPIFEAAIVLPDEKGNTERDKWFRFESKVQQVEAPAELAVTRRWKKVGNGWGEATIRIQSKVRWNIQVYLPNNKTNVNNLTVQPNDVQDGGKTFRWHGNRDLTQGFTVTLPIELDGVATEYYPQIRLEADYSNPYPTKNEVGKKFETAFDEFRLEVQSETDVPFSLHYPGRRVVVMEAITR